MVAAILDGKLQDSEINETVNLVPAFLIRLCSESLDMKSNARYCSVDLENDQTEIDEDHSISLDISNFKNEPIPIQPINDIKKVVAVDVSSIKLGTTSDGLLCALRGAVVWKTNNGYFFNRCGPLVFHLTDSTIEWILKKLEFSLEYSFMDISLSNKLLIKLRNTLERWIQHTICSFFKDSLILFDGSLTTGTMDNQTRMMDTILNIARKNRNIVLSISKSTKLKIGSQVNHLFKNTSSAYVIDIDQTVRCYSQFKSMQLLGRIFIAKLIQNGFHFRLDIDRRIARSDAIDAVGKLIKSDLVSQGYPETLRLAHILSTFTATEVIGIQGFLRIRHGLRMQPSPNIRKYLFGPYGSSWEAS